MNKLNNKLKEVNQISEGFHPSLFDITFNFQGIGELPKVMKQLATGVFITPKVDLLKLELVPNKIDINFTIDTSSKDFKGLLRYLIELKNNPPKDGEGDTLGSITILYYSRDGSIFMKRIFHDVKFNYDENKYDIFDSLRHDADPIHELETSFVFEKMENCI